MIVDRRRGATREVALALAVALTCLGFYGATLLPGVGHGGDTAKFQFLGRVLGIGHPTGYPTYLLLNWGLGHLPLGNLAWRINLLSALLGAAAAGLLVPAIARTGTGSLAAVAALAFGLSYTEWSQAVIAEVYTLLAALLAGLLWALLAWGESRRVGALAVFLALLGLSFSHHLLVVTALPGFALYLFRVGPGALVRRRNLLAAAAGAALATLPYLYLPLRTAAEAPYLEGRVSSLRDFIGFVSGGPFRQEMGLLGGGVELPARLAEAAQLVWLEWTPLGLALAAAGAIRLARRSPRAGTLLGLVAGGDLLFALTYDIPDWFVYLIPFHLVAAFALAHGLAWMAEAAGRRLGAGRGTALAAVAGMLGVAGLAWVNLPLVDRSRDIQVAEAVAGTLRALPEPAVVLTTHYDLANYLYYHLLVVPEFRDRETYVVQHLSWDELRRYLEGRGRLRQIEQGPPAGVPPGVPAFVASHAPEYAAAGFRLEPVPASPLPLYRVTLPGSGSTPQDASGG